MAKGQSGLKSAHPKLPRAIDPTFQSTSRTTWEVVRRVALYLRPYKWMAAGTIACALLSLGFSLAYPKLTQFVIDYVITGKRPELLAPLMLGLIGAFLLRDLFNGIRIFINNTFEQNVIYDMRCAVYERLQRLPVGYFDQRASGDLMTRVVEDVNSVERVLIDGTEQGSVAVLGIIGVLAIMFYTNPILAAVALVPLPILAGGAWWYTSTAHRRYRVQREAASAMNALLMDNLQGVRQIKAFGREPHEDGRFAERAHGLRIGTLGIMRVWAAYSPAMSFAGALGLALVLWVGGRQVLLGSMTIGQLIGFMFYLALFYEPVSRLHGLNQMLQAARAAGERVFDIMDAADETILHSKAQTRGGDGPVPAGREVATDVTVAPTGIASEARSNPLSPGERAGARGSASERRIHPAETVELPSAGTADLSTPVLGDVRYENVCFAYAFDQPVLKNISLHARPGEMLALVGPTGAGKSTLVNLLPAFYELTSGRITIDGHDIQRTSLASLRRNISVVSQEAFLFNGTIRENILYGRLDATEAELMQAARAANCHEFISKLPQGYDARVGERGVKLSVGEKQRVSIARALLKNAPILILDEATASVDTATERLIQEALERLMENRTSFVIAHRLSTIRRASQILVLQHGEIIEVGTHDELLTGGGLYSRLARIQNAITIEDSFEKLETAAAD